MEITGATSARSPVLQTQLLRLPAELRVQIWKYALGGKMFEVYCWPSYNYHKNPTRVLNRERNCLSLLRTCRQIYQEARLIPFTSNRFRIKNESGFQTWLDELDTSQQEAIAELHLVTLGAMQMVGHLYYVPKLLPTTQIIQRLPGLRKLCIEIRSQSNCPSCRKGVCEKCTPEETRAKERSMQHISNANKRIDVVFKHVSCTSSTASSQS
jgi:hypothetical protein